MIGETEEVMPGLKLEWDLQQSFWTLVLEQKKKKNPSYVSHKINLPPLSFYRSLFFGRGWLSR